MIELKTKEQNEIFINEPNDVSKINLYQYVNTNMINKNSNFNDEDLTLPGFLKKSSFDF